MIYNSVLELIGSTPILKLNNYGAKHNLCGDVYVKLENRNPGGSAKDRPAYNMLKRAEEKGLIKKGATIIEPTSGNTGLGLAVCCAALGYKLILTMPETMSIERRKLASQYGAEIVLTPAALGMKGAVDKAEELKKNTPNSFLTGQFDNPDNPMAHYLTTAEEILKDMERVDYFVAGVGTGGTVSGCGKRIKESMPDCKVIAVEPYNSPLLSKGYAGKHNLQGIGANFVPKNLDRSVLDGISAIKEEDAYRTAKELASTEGILVGITSGAAVYAAKLLAEKEENKGKIILAVVVDTGERYLSTPLFD